MRSAILERAPLLALRMKGGRPAGFAADAEDHAGWSDVTTGDRWGGSEAWAVFKATFRVPDAWAGSRIRLRLELGGQGMAYLDGTAWQGLDENHRHVTLPSSLVDGKEHVLLVEAYAMGETTAPRAPGTTCAVGECSLECVSDEAEALAYDLLLGADTVRSLPPEHPARQPLEDLLLECERAVDRRRPGSDAFFTSVREARAVLAAGLPELAHAFGVRATALAMGHAHIDTAWLWTLGQTRRKVARSWSTALRLMEQYPDFHFLASQSQQYKWIEEDEPALYREILARVREGRWEPAAAMWVEPDVNLTSGESLVRQLLHGQRDSLARFGARCEYLWLPDTFGYSAALPGLMRSAGVIAFVTSKLSWNTTNRMPHDTFRWRGLDGSEVLAFFITAGIDPRAETWITDPDNPLIGIATYNGHFTAHEVSSAWQRYRDKARNDTVLYPFGWGDGGGGPTEQMLEMAARMRAYPGLPAVRQGSAGAFLKQLHERAIDDPRTPVWDGEMYLEYHRGVYTSQAGVKAGNRRCEHDLHDAELWVSWAAARGAAVADWQARLGEAWELLLVNQFHDILPGSSIGDVYVDQAHDHACIQELAADVRQQAQAVLAEQVEGPDSGLVLFNSTPWPRADVEVDATELHDVSPCGLDGSPLPVQRATNLDGRERVLVGGLQLPPMGYQVVGLGATRSSREDGALVAGEQHLENQFFTLTLDKAGRISRLYDKRFDRDVLLPHGGGNRLIAFEDKPMDFDAWDIDAHYVEKFWDIDELSDLRVIERGPLRAGVELRRSWDGSTITQRILLHKDIARIDFQTSIMWHHHQVLLKAAFPLNIRATHARYECAFGWVERPTHRNTSWDAARFEVAGHRWADLSEADYGVSLLNDAKYGYDCLDSTLRLTLLKSGIYPDPSADQGAHYFSYALLPHGAGWMVSDTVQAAYELNLPVSARLRRGSVGGLPATQSLVSTNSRHAVVDTVKPAEDGDGIVVRVYDCAGGRERTTLTFATTIEAAESVNILEDVEDGTARPHCEGNSLTFDLGPFSVRSFRVHLA